VTRFQALVAANMVLAIPAVLLIAAHGREGDASTRFAKPKITGPAKLYTLPLTATASEQQALTATRAIAPPTRVQPVTPLKPHSEFEVTVDATGRPYDVPLQRGATIERRPLTVIHAPSRRVAFLGGEEVPYPYAHEFKTIALAERPGRLYPVDAIWVDEKRGFDRIVGVVIVERDTPVARWRMLRTVAYGTDAGLGAVTTREWLAKPEAAGDNVLARRLANWPKRRRFFVANVDGHRGVDTVVFENGFGDGGFPAIAGYDASGARAAIVLWTIAAPWRLAFPQGEPPQQVTGREDILAACLAGRRTVDGARCRSARTG
jgi:hypothetical protein